ncbi:MAG: TIGR03084 family metal-binding protein [Actinomycetes bacterium]
MGSDRSAALASLIEDLAAEVGDLAAIVDPLSAGDLNVGTPASGWTIADQIGHLAAFDQNGARAIEDPDAFRSEVAELVANGADPVGDAVTAARRLEATAVRDWWHEASARMRRAALQLDADHRIPWYGPDMGARSFVTARLMEIWAHGHDVRDALGVAPAVSDRLRHVVDLGVRARPYAYAVRGRPVPETALRVEAISPSGLVWTWGPPDAVDVVRGTALDLSLLVTQRRHRSDLELDVSGPAATEWVSFAQAFAGPAGPGRPPQG